MAYMHIEILDSQGHLNHTAIVTADECAKHFPDDRINIVGFMSDEEAKKLTFTERGLAHLDE